MAYICNQKQNTGTALIKNWTNSQEWKLYYPSLYKLTRSEEEETLLLRMWQEYCSLFLDY